MSAKSQKAEALGPFLVITADRRGRGARVRVRVTDPVTVGQLMSAWSKIERFAMDVNHGRRLLGGLKINDPISREREVEI